MPDDTTGPATPDDPPSGESSSRFTRLRIALLLVLLAVAIALFFLTRSSHQEPAEQAFAATSSRATATATANAPTIRLEPYLRHDGQLTYLTTAGDGSGRLFLVQRAGQVFVAENGSVAEEPYLDIRDRIRDAASEQGLLSLAFSPDFSRDGRLYIDYTGKDGIGATRISRFVVDASTGRPDPASEEILLEFDQPAPNHNGGQLQFGPDGMLWIGTGDGGMGGDPWDNAESLDTYLGKLLRVDVSGPTGYEIPSDNPYVGRADALGEIWSYGLRNPWRFSFDDELLYVADVGQNQFEEITAVSVAGARAGHFGWDTLEGNRCFEPRMGCEHEGTLRPTVVYEHGPGCSVTGGYAYRGQRHPSLVGIYFFGDYCSGQIWGLWREGDTWVEAELLDTELNIASFGRDEEGEVYVVSLDGAVARIVAD